MAEPGKLEYFAGLSVFQEEIGKPLVWFPALGTPELEEMIHAIVPGPAPLPQKRTKISLDYFNHAQQTGMLIKFYPLPEGVTVRVPPSAVPSPALSGFSDSGYASSLHQSPAMPSLHQSPAWTVNSMMQSPATFAVPAHTAEPVTEPVAEPVAKPAAKPVARAKAKPASRASAPRKSSKPPADSQQETVDFSNHPGMRILTKDGTDVTSSASRGSKTKEQREHAHLMRRLQACPECRRKKIRCDPSHRLGPGVPIPELPPKKVAKRTKKGRAPSVDVVNVPPKFADAAAPALAPEPVVPAPAPAIPVLAPAAPVPESVVPAPSSDFNTGFHNDAAVWNEPTSSAEMAVSDGPTLGADITVSVLEELDRYLAPKDGAGPASPLSVFTPFTPPASHASPAIPADVFGVHVPAAEGPADAAPALAFPYLNPGVAHGTNYADFVLYSPPQGFHYDDPAFQLRDLGSQQHSPQSHRSTRRSPAPVPAQAAPAYVGPAVAQPVSIGQQPVGNHYSFAASPTDTSWYYDPGDTGDYRPQPGSTASSWVTASHGVVAQDASGDGQGEYGAGVSQSSVEGLVQIASCPAVLGRNSSTVLASTARSPVSPRSPHRHGVAAPRRCAQPSHAGPTPAGTGYSQSAQHASIASAGATTHDRFSPGRTTAQPSQAVAGGDAQSLARHNGQHAVARNGLQSPAQPAAARHDTAAAGPPPGPATLLNPTPPTRRNAAGQEHAPPSACAVQLAALGLVSLLCAAALRAHLASQLALVHALAITIISLAPLRRRRGAAPAWCCLLPAAAWPPPPSSSSSLDADADADAVKSKIPPVAGDGSDRLWCVAARWARRSMPRLSSAGWMLSC